MTKFTWKNDTATYATGSLCMAGDYVLGSTFYGTGGKVYTGKWRAEVKVPGVKVNPTLRFEDEAEAKACVERILTRWFEKVNANGQ